MPATLLDIFIMYECIANYTPEKPERHYFDWVRPINSRLVISTNNIIQSAIDSASFIMPHIKLYQ